MSISGRVPAGRRVTLKDMDVFRVQEIQRRQEADPHKVALDAAEDELWDRVPDFEGYCEETLRGWFAVARQRLRDYADHYEVPTLLATGENGDGDGDGGPLSMLSSLTAKYTRVESVGSVAEARRPLRACIEQVHGLLALQETPRPELQRFFADDILPLLLEGETLITAPVAAGAVHDMLSPYLAAALEMVRTPSAAAELRSQAERKRALKESLAASEEEEVAAINGGGGSAEAGAKVREAGERVHTRLAVVTHHLQCEWRVLEQILALLQGVRGVCAAVHETETQSRALMAGLKGQLSEAVWYIEALEKATLQLGAGDAMHAQYDSDMAAYWEELDGLEAELADVCAAMYRGRYSLELAELRRRQRELLHARRDVVADSVRRVESVARAEAQHSDLLAAAQGRIASVHETIEGLRCLLDAVLLSEGIMLRVARRLHEAHRQARAEAESELLCVFQGLFGCRRHAFMRLSFGLFQVTADLAEIRARPADSPTDEEANARLSELTEERRRLATARHEHSMVLSELAAALSELGVNVEHPSSELTTQLLERWRSRGDCASAHQRTPSLAAACAPFAASVAPQAVGQHG